MKLKAPLPFVSQYWPRKWSKWEKAVTCRLHATDKAPVSAGPSPLKLGQSPHHPYTSTLACFSWKQHQTIDQFGLPFTPPPSQAEAEWILTVKELWLQCKRRTLDRRGAWKGPRPPPGWKMVSLLFYCEGQMAHQDKLPVTSKEGSSKVVVLKI